MLQGGGVESEEKGEIKCEVEGRDGVKILKIVEEGYQVTEDDVKAKKVLVELDSADLRNRITQQEISLSSTAATLTDAQQSYAIQVNQNLSDVMAAVQKARFARMDFDKYMGDQAAEEIIAQLGIKTELAEAISSPPDKRPRPQRAATGSQGQRPPSATSITGAGREQHGLAWSRPGGTARFAGCRRTVTDPPAARRAARPLRRHPHRRPPSTSPSTRTSTCWVTVRPGRSSASCGMPLQVAQKEQQQAQSTLDGTQRLFAKDFVTKTDLDRDQLAFENSVLKVKKADTAYSLFQKYEFPKAAEEALSKYTEALRELDRTKKGAISRLAQADAKLKSAQARYNVEDKQRKDLHKQLEKSTIRAPRPGLVVYGGGGEVRYWRNEEQIREGATVREGQTVVTIPDMTKMCIKVKIHESYIKRIQKGQKARITADAFPDRKLEGEVSQVGVLPDSENSWLNPDMKVYRTTITINGQTRLDKTRHEHQGRDRGEPVERRRLCAHSGREPD